eukprot:5013942-Amphidinium_carterae.1
MAAQVVLGQERYGQLFGCCQIMMPVGPEFLNGHNPFEHNFLERCCVELGVASALLRSRNLQSHFWHLHG